MAMPTFTAERSLERSANHYRLAGGAAPPRAALAPALAPARGPRCYRACLQGCQDDPFCAEDCRCLCYGRPCPGPGCTCWLV
ncbi:MAG TPA: hypothetical protein VFL91_24085 [Thermomicrobiales bacterium]|nr:hypothetical protein [Thermomicrobiales bacterium]